MTTTTRPGRLVQDLRARIQGRVIEPGDRDYDAARSVMYGGIDHRPAAIARVADVADVSAVITAARESGLPLAVRSGGHSIAGHSVVDDGIVLDLRDMAGLHVDDRSETAVAQTGLTAVGLLQQIAERGRAVGFGDTGSVGIGGITLGGGIGYLVRKHGLTIDSLLGADVVTADGELHAVDAQREPDLFWAIRGGGGNFGVATQFRYRLVEMPSFTGGMLFLPATADAVAGFVAAAEAAPEELSAIANVMPCPPMPFIPEAQHGKLVIFGLMAFAGPPDDGAAALAPFRALATPIADLVHPMPYPEIYPPEDDSYHPLAISRNLFVDEIDGPAAARIMTTLEASDASMRVAQIRVLGGASARVPNDATAYGHRERRIMVNVASFYEGPHDRARRAAWVDAFAAWLSGGDQAAYVNFLGDEGPARVRAAYPGETWDRLRAIKRRYDPDNLFRGNQNIPPA